jgi:hypothetical protein
MSDRPTKGAKKTWYSRLPTAELEKMAAAFDRPIEPAEMKPLTPAQRRQEQRARAKVGRPRVGAGAEKLRVSMERGLLKRVDAYARKNGLSRSQLIAESLRRTIGTVRSA